MDKNASSGIIIVFVFMVACATTKPTPYTAKKIEPHPQFKGLFQASFEGNEETNSFAAVSYTYLAAFEHCQHLGQLTKVSEPTAIIEGQAKFSANFACYDKALTIVDTNAEDKILSINGEEVQDDLQIPLILAKDKTLSPTVSFLRDKKPVTIKAEIFDNSKNVRAMNLGMVKGLCGKLRFEEIPEACGKNFNLKE